MNGEIEVVDNEEDIPDNRESTILQADHTATCLDEIQEKLEIIQARLNDKGDEYEINRGNIDNMSNLECLQSLTVVFITIPTSNSLSENRKGA